MEERKFQGNFPQGLGDLAGEPSIHLGHSIKDLSDSHHSNGQWLVPLKGGRDYPDASCMDYLRTLGEKWPHSKGNVGKYSLHGAFGL